MHNYQISDELSYLYYAASLCAEQKQGYDGCWQIAPFFCSLDYSPKIGAHLNELKTTLKNILPELTAHGEKRADKAFYKFDDTITKPSYIKRIRNYNSEEIDQINSIKNISALEPASGGLSFSVFHPQDLLDRQRPGYVPCLLSGCFLLHEDQLQLNAFFRSQSIIEFGIFDLIFLREFQNEVFELLYGPEKYVTIKGKRKRVEIGKLNIHLSRVTIHRRLVKKNNNFIKREKNIKRMDCNS